MAVHEKIRQARQVKGLTQEQMAEQMNCTVSSYARIERGETKVKLEKLQRIAEIIEIDLQELINSNQISIVNLAENNYNLHQAAIFLTEAKCASELEKAHLIIQHRDEQIGWLKDKVAQLEKTNAQLESMFELLKINKI